MRTSLSNVWSAIEECSGKNIFPPALNMQALDRGRVLGQYTIVALCPESTVHGIRGYIRS
jgi:hypothetical protein